MRWTLMAAVVALAIPAHADDRGAFCPVTPCLPGPVTRRVLAKAEVHHGVTCKKGQELGIDKHQRLVFCTTAKPATVDGLAVAANAYTLFHPSGRIYQTTLRAKLEVALPDRSRLTCGPDAIALFDDGTVMYCKLAAPRAGSPKARVGEGISFHRGGKLAGITLDEKLRGPAFEVPAGTSVHWDDTGALRSGWLHDPVAAGALRIRSEFALHPNGKLAAITLAGKAVIQGHAFPEGADLEFRADGTLERAKYVEDSGHLPHGEQWTDTRHMTFDGRGKVTRSYLDHFQSRIRPPAATRKYRP